MLILVKAASWTAVAALAGVGLGRYWLAPERPRPVLAAALAALSLVVLGAVELWLTLAQVIGSVDLATWWRYAVRTGHGHAVFWRSAAALGLAGATLWLPRRWWPVAAALGLWLCYGFSRLSHAAALAGTGPLLVDLVHLVGAALWAGGVWRVALARGGPGVAEVERLSRLALWVVVSLALTGVVSGLVHASEPERFLASGYAVALGVKLSLVAAALGLAAVNRFVLLPRARRGRGSLRAAVWAESAVLLGVLVVTGWLTTSPVPHGAVVEVDVVENLRRLVELLAR